MYDEIITSAELHRLSSTALYIRENLDEFEYEHTLARRARRLDILRSFAADLHDYINEISEHYNIDEILERLDEESE